MTSRPMYKRIAVVALGAALLAVGVSPTTPEVGTSGMPIRPYLVQGTSADHATMLVNDAGASVERTLGIIDAVATSLSPAQHQRILASHAAVRIFDDATAEVTGAVLETHYPTLIGAADLHRGGINGRGIGVAVLDTGLWKKSATQKTAEQSDRILAQFDVIRDRLDRSYYKDGKYDQDIDDTSGHGTHVAAVMASSDRTEASRYQGVAPSVNLIAVRAFGSNGSGQYRDVIAGLDWVVKNKLRYKIRVLNLSFSAEPRSAYWDDPLNQAVMAAWKAGIVVVVSGGNSGPTPGTIGVPGNIPYVITVGAMTDNYTPSNPADDRLATFSSVGPTDEGFVKPELMAPGGHMVAWMPPHGLIASQHPEFMTAEKEYFTMSGTSQAAAVVSGVVALMLQVNPALTPDQVKCRLLSTARPAVTLTGELAYSVVQQGAGLVNAPAAVYATAQNCANVGLNIAADLAGTQHYLGPIRLNGEGEYTFTGPNGEQLDGSGYIWSRDWAGNTGYIWSRTFASNSGYIWSRSSAFNQGYLWSRGYIWSQNAEDLPLPWSEFPTERPGVSTSFSINSWVKPE